MSLVARHLEENGIATVVLGSAHDIVLHCGVPRLLFTDFPLGNPCGKPWDVSMQREIVSMALELLEAAKAPRTVRRTPFRWLEGADDEVWRRAYLEIDPSRREELRRAGQARRTSQGRAKAEGTARSE